MNRSVVIERPVSIGSLEPFEQREAFESRPGWVAYLRTEGILCNLTICREFLASLLPVPGRAFHYLAHIRGREVPFNPAIISTISGIPVLPDDGYDVPPSSRIPTPSDDELASFLADRPMQWIGTQFDKSNIAERYRTLWLVVANAIDPTSHTQHLYPHHAYEMRTIARNRPFCFARHVIIKIARMYTLTTQNEAIKFGVLLTRICLRAGVLERDTDIKKPAKKPMNQSTQLRAAGQLRYRASTSSAPPPGEETEGEGPEEAGPDVPGPSRRRRRASGEAEDVHQNRMMDFMSQQFERINTRMDERFDELNERVDTMGVRQDQMQAELEAQMQAQAAANREFVFRQFEVFYRRFPPPPSDQ